MAFLKGEIKKKNLYEKPIGRQLLVKKTLATHLQYETELHVAFMQDALSLCQIKDPYMPHSTTVEQILKGIADEAFHLVVFRKCATVGNVVDECRHFELSKSRFIIPNLQRLASTFTKMTQETM